MCKFPGEKTNSCSHQKLPWPGDDRAPAHYRDSKRNSNLRALRRGGAEAAAGRRGEGARGSESRSAQTAREASPLVWHGRKEALGISKETIKEWGKTEFLLTYLRGEINHVRGFECCISAGEYNCCFFIITYKENFCLLISLLIHHDILIVREI